MRYSQKGNKQKKLKPAIKKGGFFDGSSDEDSEDGLGFLGSKRPIQKSKTTKPKPGLKNKLPIKQSKMFAGIGSEDSEEEEEKIKPLIKKPMFGDDEEEVKMA